MNNIIYFNFCLEISLKNRMNSEVNANFLDAYNHFIEKFQEHWLTLYPECKYHVLV